MTRKVISKLAYLPDGEKLERSLQDMCTVKRTCETAAANIAAVGSHHSARQLAVAARHITDARDLFCAGSDAGRAAVEHFAWLTSALGLHPILLEEPGNGVFDALRHAGADDVLVFISSGIPSRASIEIIREASCRGLQIVAITDGRVPPPGLAITHISVETAALADLQTLTPVMATVEVLTAVTAEKIHHNMEPVDRTGSSASVRSSDY